MRQCTLGAGILMVTLVSVALPLTLSGQVTRPGGARPPVQQLPPAGQTIDTRNIDQRPPGPGPALTVAATGPTSVSLSWPAVAGALNYTVLRNPSTAPQVLTAPGFTATTFTDAGVPPRTNVAYLVRADFGPSSAYSPASSEVRTVLTPAAVNPAGFTATAASPSEVTLTWNAATGASYYWLQGTGVTAQKVLGTTFPVRGIVPGTSEWRLIAYYEVGGQAFGDEAAPSRATLSTARTSGRYRATITGFRVNHETADAPLEGDGKRDEVYLAAFVWEYDKTQPSSLKESNPPLKTPVYGDTGGFPLRVQAGRGGDKGELMTDDNFPYGPAPWARSEPPRSDQLPLQLWEGELKGGQNVVVIEPVIWERDDDPSLYDNWRSTKQIAGRISRDVDLVPYLVPFKNALTRTGDPVDNCFQNCIWNPNMTGEQGKDRPIGLSVKPIKDPQGELHYDWARYGFNQRTVVLNFDTAEGALQQSSSIGMKGAGVISIQFRDQNQSGKTELNGDYTLYVLVERLP